MLWYCLNCRKNIESKRPKFVWTKNGRICIYEKVQCVIDIYLRAKKEAV